MWRVRSSASKRLGLSAFSASQMLLRNREDGFADAGDVDLAERPDGRGLARIDGIAITLARLVDCSSFRSGSRTVEVAPVQARHAVDQDLVIVVPVVAAPRAVDLAQCGAECRSARRSHRRTPASPRRGRSHRSAARRRHPTSRVCCGWNRMWSSGLSLNRICRITARGSRWKASSARVMKAQYETKRSNGLRTKANLK